MNYNGKNRLKELVKQHWEKETCGIRYGASPDKKEFYLEIERNRYYLEPYILEFAGFSNSRGIKVLEIGIGGSGF